MGHEGGDCDNSWIAPEFLGSLTCSSLLSCNQSPVLWGWTIAELVHLSGLNLPWKLGGETQSDFLQGLLLFGLLAGLPCDNPTAGGDVT